MKSTPIKIIIFVTSFALCGCANGKESQANKGESSFSSPRERQLIHEACTGNVEKVEEIIKSGADPNRIGRGNTTPTLEISKCGNASAMDAVLRLGGDPNFQNDLGHTVLLNSIDRGWEFVSVVISHGADLNMANKNKATPLRRALIKGVEADDFSIFKGLVEAGADINRRLPSGNTIALSVISIGRPSLALFLLDHGYHVDLNILKEINEIRVIDPKSPEAEKKKELSKRLNNLLME